MFTTTTHAVRCHVCAREFDLRAEFVSGLPSTWDGRLVGTCNMHSNTTYHHEPAEIRASWLARNTPTASERIRAAREEG